MEVRQEVVAVCYSRLLENMKGASGAYFLERLAQSTARKPRRILMVVDNAQRFVDEDLGARGSEFFAQNDKLEAMIVIEKSKPVETIFRDPGIKSQTFLGSVKGSKLVVVGNYTSIDAPVVDGVPVTRLDEVTTRLRAHVGACDAKKLHMMGLKELSNQLKYIDQLFAEMK